MLSSANGGAAGAAPRVDVEDAQGGVVVPEHLAGKAPRLEVEEHGIGRGSSSRLAPLAVPVASGMCATPLLVLLGRCNRSW
jgi:hypothetical protein